MSSDITQFMQSQFSGRWFLIDSGSACGKTNMEIDVKLVNEFKRSGVPFLRFYQWQPYCISLGKNQSIADIDVDFARRDGIDVVFRPTGGKAVLHAEELTYSIVTDSHGLSILESYNLLSAALSHGIKNYVCRYNSHAAEISLAESMPDFRKLFKQPDAVVCFMASAKFEIEFRGRKLVGSAQRRFGNIVLQHGSILVGDFHKKIVQYLRGDTSTLEKVEQNLNAHTITLNEITGQSIDYHELKNSIVDGFVETLGIKFERVSQQKYIFSEHGRFLLNEERESV